MFTLFNSDVCDYIEKNKDYINEYMQEKKFNDIYEAAADLIAFDYSDLEYYLNNFEADKIRVVASLHLWHGVVNAKKDFKTLKTALYACFEEYNKLYFKNNNSALTLEASHHDGTNTFKSYKVVNGKKYAIKINDLIK